jgi:hypothetical protein
MAITGSRLAARAVLAATGIALASRALGQAVAGGPLPAPLPLFPADNWWNADVSAAPVDVGSATFIAWIGAAKGMHPDFGGDASPSPAIYGMPYVVVPGTQPLERVAFDYATESDPGAPGRPAGYPIPVEAKTQPRWIEGGYPGNCDSSYAASPCRGDKHLLIVDSGNRLLFETWNTRCLPAGNPACTWRAGSGAVFPLDGNLRRPDGWTSADAAGLAILPGLVRYDEVAGAGAIRHAFRVTLRGSNGYVYPASHAAGSNPSAPPLGTRLRLKASSDISSFPAPAQKIFQAMKTYGLIVADNGSDLYVQGAYDTRWDNGVLNPAFAAITASDFEVVKLGWQPASPGSAAGFVPLAPCRLIDTRNADGPLDGPPLGGAAQRTFTVTSTLCGVPPGALAISANVTAVNPAAPGYAIAFPAGIAAPLASTVSFGAGGTRANNALIGLSPGGSIAVRNNSAGTLDIVVDVNGYYQ